MVYLNNDKELFQRSIRLAVNEASPDEWAIEKDYYITMLLKKLSEQFEFLVFKGGTSLSKCYRVIERFSEDIDITIDKHISQGQRKKLKKGITAIASELGLRIPNIDSVMSRMDYNRYDFAYDSVIIDKSTGFSAGTKIILETSLTDVSFPVEKLPVYSLIGDMFSKEAPDYIEQYGLAPFNMKVQGLQRTFIDKVFAICDYYLKGSVERHSRHIYDIHKLLSSVRQDSELRVLIKEVRALRARTKISPSAQPDVDISYLLKKIASEGVYKEDYETLTTKLLNDETSYNDVIESVRNIAASGIFSV